MLRRICRVIQQLQGYGPYLSEDFPSSAYLTGVVQAWVFVDGRLLAVSQLASHSTGTKARTLINYRPRYNYIQSVQRSRDHYLHLLGPVGGVSGAPGAHRKHSDAHSADDDEDHSANVGIRK